MIKTTETDILPNVEDRVVEVRSATVSKLEQNEDSSFDPSAGLSCSDPLAELVNGTCMCLDKTQDLGQGCRYNQPEALLTFYGFMLHNASHIEDEDGEDYFTRINKHGNNERRDRVIGMVDQVRRVMPKLLRYVKFSSGQFSTIKFPLLKEFPAEVKSAP